MKCSDAHELMGDYLEGALAPEDVERLREHLESCADCQELLEDFEDIARQARELPRLEPSDAAWPAILRRVREARTEAASPAAPRRKWYDAIFAPGRMVYTGAAALLVLAAVAGLVLLPGGRGPAAGLSESDRFTLAKLEEAEKYYTLAIKALTEAVGSPRSGLDPQVAAVFERNLREIDASIQACQSAVKAAPGDVAARTYLLGAYKSKVEFLDNVIEVEKNTAPARTGGRTL